MIQIGTIEGMYIEIKKRLKATKLGWSSIFSSLIDILIGIALILYGQVVPRVGFQIFRL